MADALSMDGGGAEQGGSGAAASFSALRGLARVATDDAAMLATAVARCAPFAPCSTPSRLTPAGAPLEAAVVWPTPGLRVSLDPCPDASPDARVLSCYDDIAQPFTAAQVNVMARVGMWRKDHPGRYGAWLGLRVVDGDLRKKLYLDVPEGCGWSSFDETMAGRPAVLPRRQIRMTMIGLDPVSGGVELYYRSARLFPAELDTLMRRFGLDERGQEIVDLLSALTQRSIRFELPSHDMGFSVAFDPQGAARVFTFYSNATALLGPAARARAALLRVGRERDWPMQDYDALSAPDGDGLVPEHGLVGAMLAADQPMHATATVALSPPDTGASSAIMPREACHA
jgi:hypothetical protein